MLPSADVTGRGRRPPWAWVLAGTACLAGCNPSPSAERTAPVTILASADVAGWIVPCGCTSGQSGGLPRRGRLVAATREHSEVLVVDVGGAAAGTSRYDRLEFEAILRGELAMGLVAHNIGASEVAFGGEAIRRLAAESAVPFVSANLRDARGPLAPASHTVAAKDGRRIMFIGVVSPSFVQPLGLRASPPHEAVLAELETVKPRPDFVVVLAYLPEDELVSLATLAPEVDLVIGGPTGQSMMPRDLGPTTVMAVTNKGKFVARVRLPDGSGGLRCDVVELGETFEDDAKQLENVQAFHDELAHLDIAASETGFVPTSLVGSDDGRFVVAGTDACRACHTADTKIWEASAHAHAWETLAKTGSHVDPSCQHCHTTGFGRRGGFESVRRSPSLTNVGCESCHGPSAAHAADPRRPTGFGAAAKDHCTTCHDRENSPHFEHEKYWSEIIHGREPARSSRPDPPVTTPNTGTP